MSQKYSKLVEQCLSNDQSQLTIESTKIKKKSAPLLFKSIHSVSGLTSLEIRSCRLKKIPPEVNLLTSLRVLKLDDNLIQDLPPMDALTNLKELSMVENDLHNLPEAVTSLHSLTSLDLTANSVAWVPGTVYHLTSLIHLNLDSNSLPYFPIPVGLLTSLKILSCNDNGLRVFPAQAFDLTRLQALMMAHNAFQYVPPEIQCIKRSLTYLDLSENAITTLPAELGQLTKLRTLLLQHNKLVQLPAEIGNMESLLSLKLHDNQITSLPDTIGKLTNLVELHLQENMLGAVPPQLGDCISLRKLRLEYNKVAAIPEALSKLSKLNVFMLHDNHLHDLPSFLHHPHYLRHLLRITLHDNHFSESMQAEILQVGALNFLLQSQEVFDNTPNLYGALKKSPRKDTIRRPSRASNDRRTSFSDVEPSNEGNWLQFIPGLAGGKVLTPTSRRRAQSLDESAPGAHVPPDALPRSRSASLGNTLPAPPYRTFQGVYEYLVDELDLSGKRKEMLFSMTNEEKWKLLSNISRESAMNLLVTNQKVRSAVSLVNSPAPSAPGSPAVSMRTASVPSSARGLLATSSPALFRGVLSSPAVSSPALLSTRTASPAPALLSARTASPAPAILVSGSSSPGRHSIPVLNLSGVSTPTAVGSPKSPRSPSTAPAKSKSSIFSRSPRNNPTAQQFVLSQSITAESVTSIKEMLLSQSVAKITCFAESGGIEQILQIVKTISGKAVKSDEDYTALLEALHCITILLGLGLESVLISDAVDVVMSNIMSEYLPLKEATISVLDEVCNVFYVGQGLVVDGMKNLCKRNNQSPSEVFSPLYDLIADTNIHSALKVTTMKLVNNLITNTDDLEERCKIRNNFLSLGMEDAIQKFKSEARPGREWSSFIYQIEEFEELMNDDGEEIAARFKLNQLHFEPAVVESAIQNTALRVVLPSVSHERMTCMVEQHVCDHTTTARDVIVGLVSQASSLPLKECGEYALFLPAAYAKQKQDGEGTETGYFLDDKRRVLNFALDGVILELRLKPWKLTVELCERILSSRKTALSMKELKEHLEKLLAKRFGTEEGTAVASPNTLAKHAAASLSSSSLDRPPELLSVLLSNAKKQSKSTGNLEQSKKGDNFGETSVEVDPHITCGALMAQVLRKFHGASKSYIHELEDFGFFMPNMKEKLMSNETSGINYQEAGTWLEPTEKLITYGHRVTQIKLQLRLMPKTLKIRLNEDTYELASYDESTTIRAIINDIYKRVVVPATKGANSHSSQYGVLLGGFKFGGGNWLDPDKKLKYYALPQRVTVRFALRPKALTVICETKKEADGSFWQSKSLEHFHLPIHEIMGGLQISLEGSAVYLSLENGEQLLDPNLSLFNQNVSENATLVVKPATEEICFVDPASINIWEEPENANTIFYNTEAPTEIHAATLNKIVQRLTSEKENDQVFTQMVLATYKTFTTEELLFQKLMERYNIPDNRTDSTDCSVVRLRVIVFLKNWLESFATTTTCKSFEELPTEVALAIDKFIDMCSAKEGFTTLAAPLKKLLKTITLPPINPPPSPRSPDFRQCNPMRLAHGFTWLVDDWALAYQLTVREWKGFAQIKAREFLHEKDHGEALQQMISNFNHVSAWVPIAVLSEPKLAQRARILDKFIKLASYLRDLNNFHLLTAVLSGINSSAVSRLKWTLAKIPKRSKQILEELEATMAMEGSFKNYRTALENATPPCVPYVGVYLTDLVFIEDGNPNKVGNMINMTKRRFMYNISAIIQRHQLTAYEEREDGCLPPSAASSPRSASQSNMTNSSHMANINAFLTFLYRMPIMSDKQLYDLSLTREPRNAERHDIE